MNDNFQINNILNQNEIYITSSNIISNNNLPEIYNENEEEEIKEPEKKIKLPPIKKHKKLIFNKKKNLNNKLDLTKGNIHSYFSPENFQSYNQSFNKFIPKVESMLKESFNIENMIYDNRIYDSNECKILSYLKRDELIKRSPGQGMFMRIQSYRNLNKKKPFKLILNNLDQENYYSNYGNVNYITDNNIEKVSKSSILNMKKMIKPKNNNSYKGKKYINKINIMKKPENDYENIFQLPNYNFNNNDKSIDFNKIIKFEDKYRDRNILNALEKCGEYDMKNLIDM